MNPRVIGLLHILHGFKHVCCKIPLFNFCFMLPPSGEFGDGSKTYEITEITIYVGGITIHKPAIWGYPAGFVAPPRV